MPNTYPLLPRTCEPAADFLMGDLDVSRTSYRCGRQRPLTPGEVQMASALYGRSIWYGRVRIMQESYLPLNMQPKLVAMAPNGLIYVPTDGGLYSDDYSSSIIRKKHVFIHEMCHVMQYQLGMAVFLRGMVSGLISYKYEIDFNSATQKSFFKFRMEQQASIISDYWLLANYGVSSDWLAVRYLDNYSGQSAGVLIPLYESILKDFLSARSSSRAMFALFAK